jgi:hypothetical protein
MISATEQRLIETMIDYGAKDELIHLLCSALSTAQQENAIHLMQRHYQKHGEVTEEDMLKALLILRKQSKKP